MDYVKSNMNGLQESEDGERKTKEKGSAPGEHNNRTEGYGDNKPGTEDTGKDKFGEDASTRTLWSGSTQLD